MRVDGLSYFGGLGGEDVEVAVLAGFGEGVGFFAAAEVGSHAEEEVGDDRLVACLAEVNENGAEPLLQHVFASVKRFTAGAAQHDDITAMVVAYRSPTA